MLGVLAYYHDVTFSFNDLAFFADLFYGRLHFHWLTPFLSYLIYIEIRLFGSPGDTSLAEVVNAHLNLYLITYEYSNAVQSELAGNVCSHHVTVCKLNFERCVRECVNYNALEFYDIVLRQNDPSLQANMDITHLHRCFGQYSPRIPL